MRKETEKRYEIYREGREEGKGKGVWKRCSTGLIKNIYKDVGTKVGIKTRESGERGGT